MTWGPWCRITVLNLSSSLNEDESRDSTYKSNFFSFPGLLQSWLELSFLWMTPSDTENWKKSSVVHALSFSVLDFLNLLGIKLNISDRKLNNELNKKLISLTEVSWSGIGASQTSVTPILSTFCSVVFITWLLPLGPIWMLPIYHICIPLRYVEKRKRG